MKIILFVVCFSVSFTPAATMLMVSLDGKPPDYITMKPGGPAKYKPKAYMPLVGDIHSKFYGQFSLSSKLFKMLPGASFNPSVTPLPEVMAKAISPDARYMASVRHWAPQCTGLCWHPNPDCYWEELDQNGHLVVLDKDFNPLIATDTDMIDARLVTTANQVLIAGQFEKRWVIEGVVADSEKAHEAGFNLSNTTMTKWMSGKWEKNIMGFVDKSETLYLLYDSADRGSFSGPMGLERVEGCDVKDHNSAHPIFLPTVNKFLGVSHRHACPTKGSRWGSRYLHRFFLMSGEPPFTIEKLTPVFSFPSLHPEKANESEIIQYVTGLAFDPDDEDQLIISYGIQDCEAAVVRIRVNDVLGHLTDSLRAARNFRLPFHVEIALSNRSH